ncbi:MAG: undecaprenyl-diphosphate phosphatase [Bacteroidota bacterium]
MSVLEAIILGLIQGLTEFLPVSSSGHIEIGKVVLGSKFSEDITFTIVVHGATVLSTIVIFYRDILKLVADSLKFQWNESVQYISKIVLSMIPVGIVGAFFKEEVETLFGGNIVFVGVMLLFTASLLTLANFIRKGNRNISFIDAFVIGISQAIAVLPGISRSGVTIAAGLLLGNKKETIAKFSFLMVLIPIIGANAMDLFASGTNDGFNSNIGVIALSVGFITAFISGLFACKWMIGIVRKGNLIYFAIYCIIMGTTAIIFG